MFVAKPMKSYIDPATYDGTDLPHINFGNQNFFPVVEKFFYLGTYITRDCRDSHDVTNRIRKAGNAFRALRSSLFSNKSISYEAKSAAYRSLILSLLYEPNQSIISFVRFITPR